MLQLANSSPNDWASTDFDDALLQVHLTDSVYEVVLQNSQIRQLILYISNNRGEVEGFWGN